MQLLVYWTNPIAIYGAVLLAVGALLLLWRWRAKSPEYKTTADLAVRSLLVVGAVWLVLGTVTGLTHMMAHAECKPISTEKEPAEGCKYFIEKYGI